MPTLESSTTVRFRSAAACLAIVLFFLAVALIVTPLYDTPLYDDWAYCRAVKTLLDEGRLFFTWTATSLLFQVAAGALVCTVFGFSFGALHVVGLLFSLAGALALFGYLRRLGRVPVEALLVTLFTVSTPFYFHFSFTFMNDIPALATLLAALFCYARAEMRGTANAFLIAAAAALISGLTRDFSMLLTAAALITWFAAGRRRGPHLLFLTALPAFVLFLVLQRRFIVMPFRAMKTNPDFFDPQTLLLLYKILCYLGLFFFPLLLAFVPGGVRPGGFLRGRRAALLIVLLILLAGISFWQYHEAERHADRLMPYRPGFLNMYGAYNEAPLPGDRAPLLGPGPRIALTAVSIGGAALLLLGVLLLTSRLADELTRNNRLRRFFGWTAASLMVSAGLCFSLASWADLERFDAILATTGWKVCLTLAGILSGLLLTAPWIRAALPEAASPGSRQREDQSSRATLVPLHLFTLGILLYYLATGKFFIRYALLLVPGAIALPFDAFRNVRLNRTILISGLIVYLAFSVVFTRDQIAFNEARWSAARQLLEEGVAPGRIEGGFEFNCWHGDFGGAQPSPQHEKSSFTNKIWLIPDYLLTLDTFSHTARPAPRNPEYRRWRDRTYRRINSIPYRATLHGRQRAVEVWEQIRRHGSVGTGPTQQPPESRPHPAKR